jgi:hypothetical protein
MKDGSGEGRGYEVGEEGGFTTRPWHVCAVGRRTKGRYDAIYPG